MKYKVITIGTIEHSKTLAEQLIDIMQKGRYVSEKEQLAVKEHFDCGVKTPTYLLQGWFFTLGNESCQGDGLLKLDELFCGYSVSELFELASTKLN